MNDRKNIRDNLREKKGIREKRDIMRVSVVIKDGPKMTFF